MIKKTISILLLSFILQLILSCDYDCNRPKPEVFMEFTELIISAKVLDQETDRLADIQDSILKKNFWLVISMQDERIAKQARKATSFGFNSANAIDCGPPLVYEDLISQINITMIDANNILPDKEVSTLFGYQYDDSNYKIYLEDYLKEQTKYEPESYFSLACLEPEELYAQAHFTVDVILESGKVFSENTDIILFKD